ncbi:uncharacterized protein PAC_12520 [Phialocephala subalpina]|uniref:F-box domain-containing protein n=1 Tax=Phialocephala subalpina TaxID=576137 RepID=A0A1L7XC79_9HELO|nr:uncharacterized protein PAC_12520 [Phialocephala subalpina]
MPANQDRKSLPLEIILNVIDFVTPTSNTSPIALVPGHPTTKTILSLTLTSRAIHPVARRLLYANCMYIHTSKRLSLLVRTLTKPHDLYQPSESAKDILPCITSLYLRPFPLKYDPSSLDFPTSLKVEQLLKHAGPYLRRLLIDMPLRSLYPEDDALGVKRILRSAFTNLPVLEEFCTVRDELFLSTKIMHPSDEPHVWSLWSKLRTLALYNPAVDDELLQDLKNVPNIETVVFTRSDCLEETDIKQKWERLHRNEEVRPVEFLLVNVEAEHRIPLGKDRWKEDDTVKIRELNVPISYYGDEDEIVLCQQWVKRKFLSGEAAVNWT